MSTVFSNQLKALLVTADMTEQGVNIWQTNCFTVQHFSYFCNRARNLDGKPYGPTVPAYLDFTVRISAGDSCRIFYERLLVRTAFPFSFLFNASFNEMRKLSACDDALVARGYLIDVQETFETLKTEDGSQEQMLLHGRLLLSNISYPGREKVLKLIITND